ncbi:CueP family metal-binding protein [Corynebacterium sp.]|uniref:CueP family metal-binding protein n=1 Tax=Corynebacterium sp. TaxID=1720 RepID=UPI0026E05D29|nr:CueP family metal-binding protein [Corynebacterium sp.]MDO5512299.1 CueP family metal-binding protein [Corynebacterium sp.]
MTATRRFRRRAAIAVFTAGAVTLTGCSPSPAQDASTEASASSLESYGLAGLDARQIIEKLDTMPVAERPDDLIASVQPTDLVLTSRGQELAALPLPEDQFYLSMAPYDTITHPCHLHSLTTCRGELANEDVTITVTDESTGERIVEGAHTTYENGFVGLWLPRDSAVSVTVERGDRTATARVTTDDDDPTCLTTLQLT